MTLPFRNIRDVLGLHAKVSPHKNSVISYDAQLQRKDMTYLEFVGKSHQVANFLFEDLDIKRGDTIAIASPNHENSLLLYFASWVIGASVVSVVLSDATETVKHILDDNRVKVLFVYHEHMDDFAPFVQAVGSLDGLVQIGGDRQENYLHFKDLASNRPTTFLGDESGAKGADIPMTGGNEQTARLSDIALITYENGQKIQLTQGDLLKNATRLAQATALTGNQNALAILPFHQNFVESILTPLVSGATIILAETFTADLFWQLVVGEHCHTTVLNTTELALLVESAHQNMASGGMRFGGKVIQQDIKHFRHVFTADSSLISQIARDFEATFGLPLITGYRHPQTQALLTILPITLAWFQHQEVLHGNDRPSVGCDITSDSITIISKNGEELSEGKIGELAIKIDDVWQGIGQDGYFVNNEGNKFFYLA
ncbi:MAG: hypothetical protein Phog2KO_42540 [Phototrophicaceae bacterium]